MGVHSEAACADEVKMCSPAVEYSRLQSHSPALCIPLRAHQKTLHNGTHGGLQPIRLESLGL